MKKGVESRTDAVADGSFDPTTAWIRSIRLSTRPSVSRGRTHGHAFRKEADLIQTLAIKKPLLTIGTSEFGEHVYRSLLLNPPERFRVAEELASELSKTLQGTELQRPIYQLSWMYPGDSKREYDTNGLVCLKYLPGFDHSARAFVFIRSDRNSPLWLCEVWHSDHPAFCPIDPGKFTEKYQIKRTDHLGFRAAVIEVLKERDAPRNDLLFDEENESLE